MKRLSFLLSILIIPILITACTMTGKKSDEIKVGVIASLKGDHASFGQSNWSGIKMAFDEINARGDLGKKIIVYVEDDRSKAEEGASAAKKLIEHIRVDAIIGEVASSISLAAAPIAQKNKVPMISPASTNPAVTKVGPYIFRVCFIDPFQGAAMAKFAKNKLKSKRAAIITDMKNDYSVGLAKFFKETFTKMGGEIAADVSYSAGDIDFKAQLTSIKNKNPDVIFIPGYYTEVGLIARQARELGLQQPLLGGDGWDSPKTVEIGGQAIENSYFSTHFSPEDANPRVQEFIKKYKEQYGAVPDAMAVLGYDAAYVLADAIKRAGGVNSEKLRDALAETKNYPGVSGSITIDQDRNAQKPLVVLKIENGQYKFVDSVM